MGVEVVYQEFNQMPSLSVAENIYLTELRGKRIVADQREFERKAAELFKEMNLDLNPKVKVASLQTATSRWSKLRRPFPSRLPKF